MITDFSLLFGVRKPILGTIKLDPLPGSPTYNGSLQAAIDRAVGEARIYQEAGLDGLILENYGDFPFFVESEDPAMVAALTRIGVEVSRATDLPIGVNVLRNSWKAALAVASVLDGVFIRLNVLTDPLVTDQGIVTGAAADALRYRRAIEGQSVRIFGDIYSKHGAPVAPRPIRVVAQDMVHRGGANAIIVSGEDSFVPINLEEVGEIRAAVPECPLIIGSGFIPANVDYLEHADGAITGYGWMGYAGRRTTDVTDADLMRVFHDLMRQVVRIRGEAGRVAKQPATTG